MLFINNASNITFSYQWLTRKQARLLLLGNQEEHLAQVP